MIASTAPSMTEAQPAAASDSSLGIRTRIATLAAVATVTLFSLMGTIGYLAMVESTRQSQREDLEARLDEFERRLGQSGIVLASQLQLDASLIVVRTGEDIPPEPDGTLQVVRRSNLDGIRAIVGTVPTRQVERTFATIRRGLWISVALAGLLVGAISWFVVDRALAPVRRLTGQAEAIEANPAHELLEEGGSGDELTELAITLNRLLNKLRLADSDRRRFVSDASHELRTPLMVISADAEYALEHEQPTSDLARSVLDQSGRLTALVDDLLTLASIDESQSPTDQVRTVSDVLIAADAEQFVATLTPEVSACPIPDISRSVANIVANARRHCETTVELTVHVAGSQHSEVITFEIDDDGPGIPTDDREQVFKRFFRPDTGRGEGQGGAGLGLAIARAEVAQVGGTVLATESPLGGARFTIRLPVRHSR